MNDHERYDEASIAAFSMVCERGPLNPNNLLGILHLQDCIDCYDEVNAAIEACEAVGTPDYECVEYWLGAIADCIVCICEIAATIEGDPLQGCDPTTLKN